MKDERFDRRRFLAIAGATAVTGLAGCTGSASSDDDSGETTTSTDGHDEGDDGHDEESGDGHGDVGDPVDNAEVTVRSSDDGQHFDPHVVRVTTGGKVTWTLESGAHTATAYASANDKPQLMPDDAAAWDSGTLEDVGESFEHTFEVEGVYHYYCVPHEATGMIGSVIVGDPDPHDQVALGTPPESLPGDAHEKIEELNAMCTEALEDSH